MSTKQSQAIWELCRQGFPLSADDAAKCWNNGQRFDLREKFSVELGRSLEDLIDQCNWEIEKNSETA
ncbi:hypothetical protein [uncultured Thiocystis sp.]|jgi:hypothetical protein|uniref:hypothetical protein n=1 Tax=uncultured Thiocystis sp. TaxID=1202134 RepID=UPI0025E7C2F7|nr:hypothetical protein [uncultured Thiocystis sp.]